MKCNKCKTEFKKDTKFCTKCGNKISIPIIILSKIFEIILYCIACIVFIITLTAISEPNGIKSGILLLICTMAICPITYFLISKRIVFLNNTPIRLIIILATFFVGVFYYPVDETTLNQNQTNQDYEQQLTEGDKKAQAEEQAKKEQEALEEQKRQEALKTQQEEQKRQEETQKLAEQQAKEERIKNGETELKNGKFTLKAGHKGYYDGFSYHITGELVNNTNRNYSYLQIEFNVYDSNGIQLGSAIANINNLEANGTWKFEAINLGSNDENIASYKVIDVTTF